MADLVALWKRGGNHEVLEDNEKAALGHIAGYLARQAIKRHKCKACSNLLLDKDPEACSRPVSLDASDDRMEEDSDRMEVEDVYRDFTKLLDRGPALVEHGGLLTPSYLAIKVTEDICQLYRWLMKDQVSLIYCICWKCDLQI